MKPEDRIAERERRLGKAYRLFYQKPLEIVRGEGVWLYDVEGDRYLDCYNNVASLGHCHPHVVNALCDQAKVLKGYAKAFEKFLSALAKAAIEGHTEGFVKVVRETRYDELLGVHIIGRHATDLIAEEDDLARTLASTWARSWTSPRTGVWVRAS